MVILMCGLGTWGILRSWRSNAETQLRLNRCVGENARALRSHLNLIETTNIKIRGLRVSVEAAQVLLRVELVPPLLAAIHAAVLAQEGALWAWKARRAAWALRRGCGQWGDGATSLPQLNLRRGLPDQAGQQPLEWIGKRPDEFRIQAYHPPRVAAARVADQSESSFFSGSWLAEWIAPFVVGVQAGPSLF